MGTVVLFLAPSDDEDDEDYGQESPEKFEMGEYHGLPVRIIHEAGNTINDLSYCLSLQISNCKVQKSK
jgi:hypothetical protein